MTEAEREAERRAIARAQARIAAGGRSRGNGGRVIRTAYAEATQARLTPRVAGLGPGISRRLA